MTPRKHAEAAIHWFNGGQIDMNPKKDAPEDEPGWKLVDDYIQLLSFLDEYSYRIHDPYRELKKRFKEGAVIQYRSKNQFQLNNHWSDCPEGLLKWWPKGYEYREKPAEPCIMQARTILAAPPPEDKQN